MTQGRSIRLFLVDGTPNGLLTAEIMNWTGHVLTGPRSKLSELVQRPECGRTGIYFLVGPDPDNSLRRWSISAGATTSAPASSSTTAPRSVMERPENKRPQRIRRGPLPIGHSQSMSIR